MRLIRNRALVWLAGIWLAGIWLAGVLSVVVLLALPGKAESAIGPLLPNTVEATAPDSTLATRLLGSDAPVQVVREDSPVPGWSVRARGEALGFIASTWEVARSVGYSGQPIDILVAIDVQGRIAGAELMRHNEPILTLGISTADIARYVDGFAGVDLRSAGAGGLDAQRDLPDIIARATVSTGVIRDAILRTARGVALGRGLLGGALAGLAAFHFGAGSLLAAGVGLRLGLSGF